MRSYVDRLLKQHILITRGIKKGTEFLINPRLISNAKLNVKTTLKTMEPYALEALIREDLRIHPDSRISDISKRLPDVALRDLRKFVYAMANDGTLEHRGGRTFRTYTLSQGKT
jgi:ATP-dependent DNA helicase RecG